VYYRNGSLPPLTPVVKNLIIANVLVLIAQFTFTQSGMVDMYKLFAQHHFLSPDFRPWQIITACFMHADFRHLLGNMIGIYVFGSWLENVWGAKKFLKFYIICGIGAGIISGIATYIETYGALTQINQFLSNPSLAGYKSIVASYNFYDLEGTAAEIASTWTSQPNSPAAAGRAFELITSLKEFTTSGIALGASGALFGLIAGSAYLFPNDTVYVQFFIPVKIKWLALFYGVGELYLALLNNPQDQVGHVAHLGGGLVGFVLVYYWNKSNRRNFY
jgi:membrane associated rhomboid family serine protease